MLVFNRDLLIGFLLDRVYSKRACFFWHWRGVAVVLAVCTVGPWLLSIWGK